MEIGVAVYWQMIVNGFFFGIGVVGAFAAIAFVAAICVAIFAVFAWTGNLFPRTRTIRTSLLNCKKTLA